MKRFLFKGENLRFPLSQSLWNEKRVSEKGSKDQKLVQMLRAERQEAGGELCRAGLW